MEGEALKNKETPNDKAIYFGRVDSLELTIKSNSEEGKEYHTSWSSEGSIVGSFDCNCPGYKFRGSCNHLKFIDSVVEEINRRMESNE